MCHGAVLNGYPPRPRQDAHARTGMSIGYLALSNLKTLQRRLTDRLIARERRGSLTGAHASYGMSTSGSTTVKVVPRPIAVSTAIVPPWPSIAALVIAMPNPVPPDFP